MFKTKNSNVMILRWLHWLDPLRQVNQNFEKSIFDKLKFNKIEKDKNRKLIIQDISNGIKDKRELIKKIFYRDSNGVNYAGLNTKLIDNLIETLFNY